MLVNNHFRLIPSRMKEICVMPFHYIFLEFLQKYYFTLIRYKIFIFSHIIVICYTGFILYILEGGSGVPCPPPPLSYLMSPSYSHSGLFCLVEVHVRSNVYCPGMAKGVWGRLKTSSGLWKSRCAYLKRLSPSTSSQCRRWTLILCAVTLDPLMHQCVDRTKVMSNLILTYKHVLE